MRLIPGRATPEGTAFFARAKSEGRMPDFYSRTAPGLTLSSIGFGTYKGEVSDEGDAKWSRAIEEGIAAGINVIDAAIRYRGMRSEPMIGRLLREHIDKGLLARDQVFVSSKGGLLGIPEGCDARSYARDIIVKRRGIPAPRIWNHMHCLEPMFIEQEIDRSRNRLGLETIDCYFLHNPELNFALRDREAFFQNIREVFVRLERRVAEGHIGAYGIASWNGFRRRSTSTIALDLARLHAIAREVAGDQHHFRYLELPISIGMPFTYHARAQTEGGAEKRFLDLAQELGMTILTSASVYEGNIEKLFTMSRLMQLAGRGDSVSDRMPAMASIPISENSIAQMLGVMLATRKNNVDLEAELKQCSEQVLGLYPAALNLVRSIPEVACALVGMHEVAFLRDNMRLARTPRLRTDAVEEFFSKLSLSSSPETGLQEAHEHDRIGAPMPTTFCFANTSTDIKQSGESWVEIDSAAIARNYQSLRNCLGPSTELLAIVKANAYGYDLVKFARFARELGIDWMGVGSMQEARKLRDQGIRTPLLVLIGATNVHDLREAILQDVTMTIASHEGLEAMRALSPEELAKLRVHLKIDSGMHRQGFSNGDLPRALEALKVMRVPRETFDGVYTHFGAAEDPADRVKTQLQIATFQQALIAVRREGFAPRTHAATTTSTLIHPEARFDLVRVGAGLFGIWPSDASQNQFSSQVSIEPALRWKVAVNEVKELKARAEVGYDFTATLDQDARIAILPVGYFHGYRRSLSNVGFVLIRGQRAPIVGRVSMYLTAIDVTSIPGVRVGDVATLVGPDGPDEITLEHVGAWAGTLNKDIACGIHADIPRYYK